MSRLRLSPRPAKHEKPFPRNETERGPGARGRGQIVHAGLRPSLLDAVEGEQVVEVPLRRVSLPSEDDQAVPDRDGAVPVPLAGRRACGEVLDPLARADVEAAEVAEDLRLAADLLVADPAENEQLVVKEVEGVLQPPPSARLR